MNADMRKEKNLISLEEAAEVLVSIFLPAEHANLASVPQLTPEVVEGLLEISWIPCMVVTPKERPLVCVAFMLMTFLALVLQIFCRSLRIR